MNNQVGKSVLITGGASGIGLETARVLKDKGWEVFLLDLKPEALASAARSIGVETERTAACDVSNEAGVDAAVTDACARGRLAAVVNAAGIAMDRPTVETSVSDFRRIIDVNLTGTFIVSRAVARHWLKQGTPGAIVNITSVSGLCGNKGRSAYGASKGGQNLLTMVMANELGAGGIRVNAIAPGPIDTPLATAIHTEDVRQKWIERVPQRRYGTPAEIANTVAFLISDEASYVNGQILAVDGGFINAGLAS